jgi:Zn finger protein HypA/HybF involved in hydrogenase expression
MSNFWDLVNIEEFWNKKEDFSTERWDVTFYCKDCEKIVKTTRPEKKWFKFICKVCDSENIAVWTLEWIKSKFKNK